MKIDIVDKYLDIWGENGKRLAYFEHFECKEKKRFVIKISPQDKEGENFLEWHNDFIFTNVKVSFFDKKPIARDVLFVRQKNDFSYIILFNFYE